MPARAILFIELPNQKEQFGEIDIYDLEGNLVKKLSFDDAQGSTLEVDLGTFNPGMYLLRIKSQGEEYKVHRVAVVK